MPLDDPTRDNQTLQGPPSYANQPGYYTPGGYQVDPGFAKFLNALSRLESGGRYDARGPVMKSGDRAYGKYQIMGRNIPAWSKKVLGKSISPEEFAASPDLQERIAQGILHDYYTKYGAQGAASAWFTGSPTAWKTDPGRSDGNATALGYVNTVMKYMTDAPTTVQTVPYAQWGKPGSTNVQVNLTAGGGSGGGGSYGGGGSGQYTGDAYDPKKIEEALAASGFSRALIMSDPSLKKLFEDTLKNKYSDEEFLNRLRNTDWYKKRDATQRSFDQLQYSDPKTWQRQIAVRASEVKALAVQMGVTIDPARLQYIAKASLRNGMSNQELQASVGAELHYDPKAAYGGDLGKTLNDLKEAAGKYYVPLDDATLGDYAKRVISGSATEEQFVNLLKQQAASKFPWLKEQLDQGFTVADLAAPYKNMVAQTLEVDPGAIQNEDKLVLQGLQYQDPANTKGGYSTMPLWKFQETLKKDPRWLKTDNARSALVDTGVNVLKDMGLVF